MRHYAHNIGDYAAATRHLSFVEDAAYRRLLDRYYQDERPLPGDVAQCCRLIGARSKEEKAAVVVVLGEFFSLEADGCYHQTRADKEIAGYQERAEVARRNGAKSGGRPKPSGNPGGYPVGTDPKPNGGSDRYQSRQLTTNHESELGRPLSGAPLDSPPSASARGSLQGSAHGAESVQDMIAVLTGKIRHAS